MFLLSSPLAFSLKQGPALLRFSWLLPVFAIWHHFPIFFSISFLAVDVFIKLASGF
jgi:hypothetical protein